MMTTWIGWLLALAALALGYQQHGWPGLALAATLIVFWLLLQFNRALRVMRTAGQRPVGHVDSAVMLNAKLRRGMRMMDIVMLTRSLGQRLSAPDAQPECWRWSDAGGSGVEVTMEHGRCAQWTLSRPAADDATA